MDRLKLDLWKTIIDESNGMISHIRFSDNLTICTCFAFVVYTLDLVQRMMRSLSGDNFDEYAVCRDTRRNILKHGFYRVECK